MQESKISYLDSVEELNSYLNKNLSKSSSIIFVDSNVSSEYKFDENLNIHEISDSLPKSQNILIKTSPLR